MKILVNSVLIVDDSDDDRYLLKRLLRRAGVAEDCTEVNDGKDALRHLAMAADGAEGFAVPELMFVDINMPRMNGFEFLAEFARLRQDKPELLPVVLTMFTSSADTNDAKEIVSYPFVRAYIVKMPISAAELRGKIETCLRDEAGEKHHPRSA